MENFVASKVKDSVHGLEGVVCKIWLHLKVIQIYDP